MTGNFIMDKNKCNHSISWLNGLQNWNKIIFLLKRNPRDWSGYIKWYSKLLSFIYLAMFLSFNYFWLHYYLKTSKYGSIGSTLACGPIDLSSNPAWGKLVWANFLKHKPYFYVLLSQMSHAHVSMKEHPNIEAL